MGNKKALSWQESVLKVLADERRAMKYDEIAERIIALKLRPSEKIGSTPANTVNVTLRNLINDGSETVVCLRRGVYILKRVLDENPSLAADKEEDTLVDEEELESTLITAYGRFWSRYMWEENEKQILGVSVKTKNAPCEVFSTAAGVYLLHMGYEVVYVGQASSLGERLDDHTSDDKRNRWDNFSWFSISDLVNKSVSEEVAHVKTLSNDALLDTLEALLIETLGPARNKKVGNGFEDKEFEQITAAEFVRRKQKK